jgi:hypothetical protein
MTERTTTEIALRRTAEVAAMLMIGDGVVGIAVPRRHIPLWRTRFAPLAAVVKRFDGKPLIQRRLFGAAQVAIGIAAASLALGR